MIPIVSQSTPQEGLSASATSAAEPMNGWFAQMCEEQAALACAFTLHGEYVFINRAMREYSGMTLPMRHGQGFRTIVHAKDLEVLDSKWRDAFGRGVSFRADVRLRDVQGRYRWFDMSSVALREAGSAAPTLWYTTAVDIHDRRVLTDELQAVLDAYPGLVALWDMEWRNRYANARHASIFGLPPEKMRGMHVREVVAQQGFDDVDEVVAAAAEGRSMTFERAVTTPTGQVRYTQMSISPVQRVGEMDGILTVAHDITEAVLVNRELEKSNAELRRSNEDLERFAYVASHDLQEPLRTISSYTKLLAERYRDKLDERGHRYVDYAVDAAQRMQQLIVGLLEISRLGRVARPKTPVDLTTVIATVRALLAKSIVSTSAKITVGPLPTVIGHQDQLVRLFQNVLSNALKFTAKHRNPEIEVGACPDNGGQLLWVADNGEGIEPTYRERVFGMFQRLHTREDVPGNGIGLAIVKRIAELHHGKVWIEASEAGGAKVLLWLPAAGGAA